MRIGNATFSDDGQSVTVRPVTVTVKAPAPTRLEPGQEIHRRFRIGRSLELHTITRPIATPCDKPGTIAVLDGVTAKGNPGREVAIWNGAEWKGGKTGRSALRITPHFWSVMAPRQPGLGDD